MARRRICCAVQNATAGDRRPRGAAVCRPQKTDQRSTVTEAAGAASTSEQRLSCRVGRVELDRTHREGELSVGLPLPGWAGRHRVHALPYATVDGGDVDDVGVGRVGSDGVDRPRDFTVEDVLYLPCVFGAGPWGSHC